MREIWLRLFARWQAAKLRIRYGQYAPDPWLRIEVCPERLTTARSRGYESPEEYYRCGGYWTAKEETKFDRWRDAGTLKGGDWDQATLPLVELPKYEGMKAHFIKDVPWTETDLYDYHMDLLSAGITVDGCTSESEWLLRYMEIDQLVTDIRTHGYRTRDELCETGDFTCLMDVPRVSIGRNGEIIFCGGGWHRVAAAKLFDIEAFEVHVLVRHREWYRIRRALSSGSEDTVQDDYSQFRNHPDILTE